jgi:hypothetical protein
MKASSGCKSELAICPNPKSHNAKAYLGGSYGNYEQIAARNWS